MDLTPEIQDELDRLEEDLRRIGVYDAHAAVFDNDGDTLVVVDASLGDIAFSDRVQNPEKARTDRTVREMDIDLARSGFADATERVRRNLAAGRSALDDGDDT